MKRLIYILMFLAAVSLMAENKTMFVHHNNEVEIFFFCEIDSIRYSNVGIDSTTFDNVCIQEIWTPDSVYRFDVAEIDSVTLQSPSTLPKPNSIDLSKEMHNFILGEGPSDKTALYLKNNTPNELLPRKDTYLYQLDRSEALPSGFAGRVISTELVDGYWIVKCESAEFYEIFDRLAWVSENEFVLDNLTSNARTPKYKSTSQLPSLKSLALPALKSELKYPNITSGALLMTHELKDIPAGPERPQIIGEITLYPKVSCISGAYIIPLSDGTIIKGRRLKSEATVKVKGNVSGRYNVGKKHTVSSQKPMTFTLPMGLGQDYTLSYKGSMALEGKMGLNYSFESEYHTSATTTANYDEDTNLLEASMNFDHKSMGTEKRILDASFNGFLNLSATISFSLVQSGDSLKSVSNVYTYGSSLIGDALFLESQLENAQINDSLYQALTATGIKASSVQGITSSIKYADSNFQIKGKISPAISENFYVVPKFYNPTWNNSSKTMTYLILEYVCNIIEY